MTAKTEHEQAVEDNAVRTACALLRNDDFVDGRAGIQSSQDKVGTCTITLNGDVAEGILLAAGWRGDVLPSGRVAWRGPYAHTLHWSYERDEALVIELTKQAVGG